LAFRLAPLRAHLTFRLLALLPLVPTRHPMAAHARLGDSWPAAMSSAAAATANIEARSAAWAPTEEYLWALAQIGGGGEGGEGEEKEGLQS